MDNASYHSVQIPGTKAPVSGTRKPEMQKWLQERGVSFHDKLTKPKLYELVQKEKETLSKTYEVDTMLTENGHHVVRLPPYHCELNPIELIWGDMKGYISRQNNTFKVNDVKHLIDESFAQIDGKKWKNACKHVCSVEQQYWKKDNIQGAEVNPIIIRLGDFSSDDDEEEEEDSLCDDVVSDGEDTEEYEY